MKMVICVWCHPLNKTRSKVKPEICHIWPIPLTWKLQNQVLPANVTSTAMSHIMLTLVTFCQTWCKVEKLANWPLLHLRFPGGVLTLRTCLATDSHLRDTDCLFSKVAAGISALLCLLCHTPCGKTDRCLCRGHCINSCSLLWTAEVIVTHKHRFPSSTKQYYDIYI